MKKKFGLWFNIVTICLCVCAIAIGVYSATTANLNASGKLGFTAHGCDVDVSGTIVGHATGNTADGLPVTTPESLGEVVEVRSNTQTLDLGSRYFTDMASTDGSAEDIVVTLTVTNKSKFKVTATFGTITTPDGVTATPSPASADLETAGEEGDEATFTITLSLTTTSSNITMPDTNNLSIAMEFNKFVEDALPLYIRNDKLFVDMGTDPDTGNPIRWYAIAKDNSTLKDTTFTNVSQATAGTYVFISEYILENSEGGDYIAFNSTMDSSNNYGANYGGSTVQTYINGTGTGSMDARYNFSSSDVWAKIEPKDCASETVEDIDTGSQVTVPATNDQTLWLLSYDEYMSWFVEGDDYSCGVGYLLNDTSTAAEWWLRSAFDIYSVSCISYMACILNLGSLYSGDLSTPSTWYGVRPAFQIVID